MWLVKEEKKHFPNALSFCFLRKKPWLIKKHFPNPAFQFPLCKFCEKYVLILKIRKIAVTLGKCFNLFRNYSSVPFPHLNLIFFKQDIFILFFFCLYTAAHREWFFISYISCSPINVCVQDCPHVFFTDHPLQIIALSNVFGYIRTIPNHNFITPAVRLCRMS